MGRVLFAILFALRSNYHRLVQMKVAMVSAVVMFLPVYLSFGQDHGCDFSPTNGAKQTTIAASSGETRSEGCRCGSTTWCKLRYQSAPACTVSGVSPTWACTEANPGMQLPILFTNGGNTMDFMTQVISHQLPVLFSTSDSPLHSFIAED